MITYFEIVYEYQEIFFLNKFYGWAKVADVDLYMAGELSDKDLLDRCIPTLPKNHTRKAVMDNYLNN